MNETEKVLNSDEKILCSGQPKFWHYIIVHFIIALAIIGLIFFYISISFSSSLLAASGSIISVLLFAGIFFGAVTVASLVVWLEWRVVFYAVTDKRVIFQSGIIARNFEIVDYDKIQDASVDVSLIDRIFGTGSIKIFSGKTGMSRYGRYNIYDTISNVPNPYDVFKLFKKTEFDIKAEMEFPGAYRPPESEGYKTEYNPEEEK